MMRKRVLLSAIGGIAATALLSFGGPVLGQSIQADGDIEAGGQLVSGAPTGIPPLLVTSTTKVSGFNADQVDGLEASSFASATQLADLQQAIDGLQRTVECNAPRWYYLSKQTFKGGEASAACVSGYHLASLWDLANLSDAYYAFLLGSAVALWLPDQGYGPPPFQPGWVRTGLNYDVVWNCRAYTSSDSGHGGTTAAIWLAEELGGFTDSCTTLDPTFWEPNWDVLVGQDCSVGRRVWCISDPPLWLYCRPS